MLTTKPCDFLSMSANACMTAGDLDRDLRRFTVLTSSTGFSTICTSSCGFFFLSFSGTSSVRLNSYVHMYVFKS